MIVYQFFPFDSHFMDVQCIFQRHIDICRFLLVLFFKNTLENFRKLNTVLVRYYWYLFILLLFLFIE